MLHDIHPGELANVARQIFLQYDRKPSSLLLIPSGSATLLSSDTKIYVQREERRSLAFAGRSCIPVYLRINLTNSELTLTRTASYKLISHSTITIHSDSFDARPTTVASYFKLSIKKISHDSKSGRIGVVTPTSTISPRHNNRKGCKWTDADQFNRQPGQAHPKTGHLQDPTAEPDPSQIISLRSRIQRAQSHLHHHWLLSIC